MNIKGIKLLFLGIGAVLFASSAMALPILPGTDSGGGLWTTGSPDADGRQATALFVVFGSGFKITLSSLAVSTSSPNEVLVGLIFHFGDGDPIIVNPTGEMPSGDGMQNLFAAAFGGTGGQTPEDVYGYEFDNNNMDGEYGFRDDLFGPTGGLGKYGFAGSSYDPLGFSQVIDSSVAYIPPTSPNGAEWGIAAGDTSGLPASVDLWVIDSLTILFATDFDFDYGELEQVHFLYGTDFESTTVPEPGTLALLGIGILLMGLSRRRRKIYIRD